jgi:ABC-type phosphate transport system substrate-binding protein
MQTAQAVVVGFHLPDFLKVTDLGLRIPREALAEIFLGRIVRWSELADWNPQLKSVDENISLVVRADPSGISEAFASALSSFSPEWNRTVGAGTQPKWPRADFSVQGDAGAAMQIRLQPYSLGYVSQVNAKMYGVKQALVSNRAGEYVAPTPSAVEAAVLELIPQFEELQSDRKQVFFTTAIVDPPPLRTNASYPISMLTYVGFNAADLLPSHGCSKLYSVLYLIQWGWNTSRATEIVTSQHVVPIPSAVYDVLQKALLSLMCTKTLDSAAGAVASHLSYSVFDRILFDFQVVISGGGVADP